MKLKKIIEIKYQDNIINVDLDNATIIDGYIPILYTNKIGEDRYIVITSVIKEDGTVLVPFRKSIATKDEVDNYLFDNDISLYKNNKAIYKVSDDLFYVIDLEKTEFTKKKYIAINLIPDILFGLVPYYISLTKCKFFLGMAAMFVVANSAVDFMNVYHAFVEMPPGSKTFLYQFNNYWYLPKKDNNN